MKNKIAITIILSLLSINNVYAECTQEEINEFKQLEDKYTITYKLNKKTNEYTITFNNGDTTKYTYLLDEKFDLNRINYINENTYSISGIKPDTYKIEVLSLNDECTSPLKTTTIKLQKYNPYSEDPICIGIEEFYLCQEVYDKDIDYETFVSRVNTYKKNKTKNNTQIQNDNNQNEINIKKYIKDNILQIIVIGLFIILLTITVIISYKQSRKSRRLE